MTGGGEIKEVRRLKHLHGLPIKEIVRQTREPRFPFSCRICPPTAQWHSSRVSAIVPSGE